MAVTEFGPWLPDRPDYSNPGVVVAENVLPAATGFAPIRQLSASTDALDARPQGAIQGSDTSGNTFQYAGDATKLYRNVSDAWTDATRTVGGAYATDSEDNWEFVAWKEKVLAVNFSDDPQQITMGSANFEVLTTDLKARHITAIRDFVVMANTFDATDGNQPARVRWSAFDDETDWTVSASTLSDFQDLQTAQIEKIFGGEYGVIFQNNSIWRMTFVGAPVVFQFDEVQPGIGLISSGAAAQDGDRIYFLSAKGFFMIENGTQLQPIGAGIVDEFINTDLDKSNLNRISAVADPSSHLVLWAYPGAGSVDGRPNKIIAYNTVFKKWSLITEETELLWLAGGAGTTMEDLDSITTDLDSLQVSLDSARWVGDAPEIGVFNDTFESGFFDGNAKTGTIETGEFEFNDDAYTKLNGFRGIITDGSTTARVGARNELTDNVSYTASLSPRTGGRITTRVNARYHRLEFTVSDDWTEAIGFQISPRDLARSANRG